MSKKPRIAGVSPAQAPATPASRIIPRLLRITDAADYLSVTFGFIETLYREGKVKSIVLGKRRLFDVRDLDVYIDQVKETAA